MKKGKVVGVSLLLLVLVLALTACTSSPATEDGEEFVIGISQFAEHSALDDARLGFEEGLKELGIDAKIVYQNAQADVATTNTIAQKFVKDKVDLIYAIATPAAQSAKQATHQIPVLFSAVTDPVKSEIVADWEDVGGNVTGTSDMADVNAQLKLFKEIDPKIETIGIIYNTSEPNSEIQIEVVKQLAPGLDLAVETVGVSNINEVPQGLDSLLKKVDAIYILSDNLIASSIELVTNKLIENQVVSVSAEESQVQGGILITHGFSYYELGKQTAQMAKEILVDGKDVSNIPVGLPEKTQVIVNKSTLKALGLDEDLTIFQEAVTVEN
ncbi:MAG TPA: ABC transporter substrate-binding protein [Tissierellaceae bacterium]|nr:ABC transporter substrate-binding protein [Tissierellaceae bacterium]